MDKPATPLFDALPKEAQERLRATLRALCTSHVSPEEAERLRKGFQESIASGQNSWRMPIIGFRIGPEDSECTECGTVFELHQCFFCERPHCTVCMIGCDDDHDQIRWGETNYIKVVTQKDITDAFWRLDRALPVAPDAKMVVIDSLGMAPKPRYPPGRQSTKMVVIDSLGMVPKPRYPPGFSWEAYAAGTMKGCAQ